MLKGLMISGAAAVVVLAAGAAELYVSPSGNNKNRGSKDAPLATIGRAAVLAKPGDTVRIGPGLYRERIGFLRSGKEGAPITFAGTRGENGEFLTVIEAPGKVITEWTPAPEIGPDIWKAPLARRPDLLLMDGAQMTLMGQQRMELKPWNRTPAILDETMIWDLYSRGEKCMRLPGFDMLRLPADIKVKHRYFGKRQELFWPVICNVLAGWHKGTLYLRFADGRKPQDHRFTATYGECFAVVDASHLNFRDLHMRGSRRQFHLKGKSSFITIENCLLMHGAARILIEPEVSDVLVRGCILTTGFIRSDLFRLRSADDMRGGLLYLVFKYVIGSAHSDDEGVRSFGTRVKITENLVLQGLIGIGGLGPDTEVCWNVVREMSSVGICTYARTTGKFHHNLVMNCGIPLRIHNLRHERAKREEYHYANLFIQGRHGGAQTFVHSESYLYPADKINFEPVTKAAIRAKKGGPVYKKNPPNPVDPGKIYIYHNTFWGGDDRQPAFTVRGLSQRFNNAVMPFYFCNNIHKDSLWFDTKTHELAGPNLHYVFNEGIYRLKRREPEILVLNKVLTKEKDAEKIWNKHDLPGLPDLTLAPDSPALAMGVDVSKPFTFNGKSYPAFKGFAPGYYKGKAPAVGALQQGESMERFIAMHRKAEAALKMLVGLKEKAAAEGK